MKLLCGWLILWFSTCSTGFDPDLDPNDNLDEDQFMGVFGEIIYDPVEKERRSEALQKNEDDVKRINREFINGEVGFYEKINPYSDLPEDEFQKQRLGVTFRPEYSRGLLIANESEIDEESERYFETFRFSRQSVPSSYSSVDKGHVTIIKNQMMCGSCVAFASIATIETAFAKITGKLSDYSEQELLDCGFNHYHAKGCDGAQGYSYFKWLVHNKRMVPMHESSYPYFNNLHYNCPAAKPYNIGAKIKDTFNTDNGNEETLKKIVAKHGAAVIAVATRDHFESYAGGVLDDCPHTDLTKENGPHAVAVVGYGSEMVNGRWTDYWLIKNSWGIHWGLKGFIKIKRGGGLCGIGKYYSVIVAEANPEPLSPTLPDYEVCMDSYKTECPEIAETNCKGYAGHCMKSCGLCKGMTPKRSMKCPDSWDTCPKMAKEGNCHHETYRVNCCISCKSNPDETEEEKEKRLCRDDYDIGREKKFCPVQGVGNCKEHAKRCKKSCGLCKGMTPHISYTCPEARWCKTKKDKCYQVGKHCPATCGLCEGMTPNPSNTCYDKHSKRTCQTECKKGHNGWNERNCKKTCGLC